MVFASTEVYVSAEPPKLIHVDGTYRPTYPIYTVADSKFRADNDFDQQPTP